MYVLVLRPSSILLNYLNNIFMAYRYLGFLFWRKGVDFVDVLKSVRYTKDN